MKRGMLAASVIAALFTVVVAGQVRGDHVDYTELDIEAINHDITVDSDGVVHIIWKQPMQPISYGHLVEGAVVHINSIPDTASISHFHAKPRLAVRNDGGSIHTAWVIPDGTRLYHSWRTDGQWQNEEIWNADATSLHIAEPVVGAAPDGTLHMIAQRWEEGVGPSPIVYFRKLPAAGWEDEAVITPDYMETGREYRDTYILVDGSGSVHAAWNRSYGYSSGDGTFEVTELPNRAGIRLYCCGDLFVDRAGGVHYALKGYPLEVIDYTYKPAGGEFAEPVQASSADDIECDGAYFYETWPGIVTGEDGRIFMVWAEADCTHGGVPFVRLAVREGDGTWSHQDLDTEADIHSRGRPSIAVAGGIVHIVWRIAGGKIVLYTIDASPPPPEEEDAAEEPPEQAPEAEAYEPRPEAAVDAADSSDAVFIDTLLDVADDPEAGAGHMSGGCGCSLAC